MSEDEIEDVEHKLQNLPKPLNLTTGKKKLPNSFKVMIQTQPSLNDSSM
jgi:hypothetical protein